MPMATAATAKSRRTRTLLINQGKRPLVRRAVQELVLFRTGFRVYLSGASPIPANIPGKMQEVKALHSTSRNKKPEGLIVRAASFDISQHILNVFLVV
jgi:hypothetical protein